MAEFKPHTAWYDNNVHQLAATVKSPYGTEFDILLIAVYHPDGDYYDYTVQVTSPDDVLYPMFLGSSRTLDFSVIPRELTFLREGLEQYIRRFDNPLSET